MGETVYRVFEDVEGKAKLLAKGWQNFYQEIIEHLPHTYHAEIQELSSKLNEALNKLIDELRNPTLVLATTGTTSSGKSTLVNLLCGAEIVPVAVSEMSAGAVTIEYSQEKSLIIHPTLGALWECGEWRHITEEEIYQRLYGVMIDYIENREDNPHLVCPQSTIYYPFRLLTESKLELPRNAKVKILDLPGLAYVGDQGNANVIKQCREALCIVTYNSEETDPQRVKSLLQEVVQQVKELGGSPARMLFVLNRIDAFRKDRNWPESENRFVQKTIRSIKKELTDHLKEYTEEIENLQVVKLSTWPALLALQIQNIDHVKSTSACDKADNQFNGLIDKYILEDLPRNTQRWSRHDRNRVAEELWQKSYAEEFQQTLRNHITQHFPQLIIPQIIERFNVTAGNAITEWIVQTTRAILNSSNEKYQIECANISQIRYALEQFLEITSRNLKEPFEEINKKIKQVLVKDSKEDPVFYLESKLKELQNIEPYDQLGEKLYPLYGWKRELGQGIAQVLESVAKSLETARIDLDSPNLKKANPLKVNLLRKNLTKLINLGYTGYIAKEGKTIIAKTDEEKNKLRQINEELNLLAIHLSLVMEEVLKQISEQEINRMYDAVRELFNCHLSYIEQGANKIAPDISIKFPESQLNRVDDKLTINLSFQAGFAIEEGTYQKAIQVAREERIWWTLWIATRTVYDTKYETRSSDNANIPSVEVLLTGWTNQAKQAEPEIVNQISHWLLEQIDSLKKNVGKVQNDIIDRYQARLDKANQDITLDYEQQRNVWQPMQQKAQNLAKDFSSLAIFLKEEV